MNKQLYNWIYQTINGNDLRFSSEIEVYLDLHEEIDFNGLMNSTRNSKLLILKGCKSVQEVESWIFGLHSYIEKCIDVENIIEDYCSSNIE